MSRNANSRFATNPVRLDMSRSKFPRNFSHKTTFNAGSEHLMRWKNTSKKL